MEITRIAEKNRDFFSHVCPMDMLQNEDMIHLGAISDEGDAIACLCAAISNNMTHINWLFTALGMREKGVAGALIEELVDLSMQLKVHGMEIDFMESNENMEDFLTGENFLVGVDANIYEVPVSDIIGSIAAKKALREHLGRSNVRRLMDNGEQQLVLDFLREHAMESDFLNGITPEISMVRTDSDGKADGCILIREVEDGIRIEYLLSNTSEDGTLDMLAAFYELLLENEDKWHRIVFSDYSGHVISLVETLTGENIDSYRIGGTRYGIHLFS